MKVLHGFDNNLLSLFIISQIHKPTTMSNFKQTCTHTHAILNMHAPTHTHVHTHTNESITAFDSRLKMYTKICTKHTLKTRYRSILTNLSRLL